MRNQLILRRNFMAFSVLGKGQLRTSSTNQVSTHYGAVTWAIQRKTGNFQGNRFTESTPSICSSTQQTAGSESSITWPRLKTGGSIMTMQVET